MLNLKKINLKGGKIFYNNYAIDPKLPFEAQEIEFDQDLLSLDYMGKYYVELDWLPAHNPNGQFLARVIENNDWEKPIFIKNFREVSLVEEKIQEAIDFLCLLIEKNK